jgi:hypothetical protein
LRERSSVPTWVFQLLLAFAAAFQLLLEQGTGAAEGLLLIQPLDLRQGGGQGGGVDALSEQIVELADHHRRQAAQLLADLVGLAHHGVEHRIFRPLGQHEVVAVHLRRPLQGAIDAAVALLHPAWVPGHIEVHQPLAVVLQIHPLAGGVGGNQDPQRIGLGRAVEAALDRLAPLITDAAMEGGDAGLGLIAAGDQFTHPALQPVFGIGVLGEDQQALAGPFRTRLSKTGAEVLADQLLQAVHTAVGLIPSCLGNLLHLAQKLPVVVGGLEG